MKLIKTPKQYYANYVRAVYDKPLAKSQYTEMACAFHAGVEAVFKFVEEYEADEDLIFAFRKLNKADALAALGHAKTKETFNSAN
jgi:hypothetical protein